MSSENDKQIAKELTLAVAAKMQVTFIENGKAGIDHNKLAAEVGEVFKVIYAAVKD